MQPADVARAAAKYLLKDKLAVLVVGNTQEFGKPLSSLGPVSNVDISIPSPPAEKEKPETPGTKPAASNPEGKALAGKVAVAMGGVEKLQAVKSLRIKFSESDPGETPAPVVVTIGFPDRMHVNVQTPDGPLSIAVSPEAAFMSAAKMGTRDMPPAQKTDSLTQIHHDPVYLAQHVNDPAFTFTAAGTEKIGDVEAGIVDVGGAVPWIRVSVDTKSARILRETYQDPAQSGPVYVETELGDWRAVGGLTLPFLHQNKQNGKDSSTVQFDVIEINPTVDPKLFEKP